MNIIISNSSEKPLYEQIVDQIKNLIMTNSLQEGDALPSMRLLAKELRISVITTKRAYEELEREGFITSVTGKGSFVAGANRELMREQQYKKLEELLASAVELAHRAGIREQECMELFSLLFKEDA